MVNGALTARVGIAAMEVCRPLPFAALPRPKVSNVIGRALTGLFDRSPDAAGGGAPVTQEAHAIADLIARWLELAGVAIIVLGIVLSTVIFLRRGAGTGGWRGAYQEYRANLGRGILLGLELLVGADII